MPDFTAALAQYRLQFGFRMLLAGFGYKCAPIKAAIFIAVPTDGGDVMCPSLSINKVFV